MNNKDDEIASTLAARGNRYGSFSDNADTAQALKDIARRHPNWEELENYHKESIDMIFHKIARILNGDPMYDDSWVDIAGYAKLTVNIIRDNDDEN